MNFNDCFGLETRVIKISKKMIPHTGCWKKTKKMADFPAPTIFNIFSRKFYGLVLWLVELIDAKGILWLNNLYGREAVRCKLKNSLKTQNMHILSVFEL